MREARVPYRSMIFVCAHTRQGEAACANPERGLENGLELVERLREEMKKRGLKGKVRVAKSGCMDVCARGPNVMVFDEKGEYAWYSQVALSDVPELVQKYFGPAPAASEPL